MKRKLRFLRTTLFGGLLFLVPIVVLAVVLGKALSLADRIVGPLAARIPVRSLIGLDAPTILAVGLIIMFCFFTGFLARTRFAQRIVNHLEDTVLSNLPGYELIKGMSASFLGVDQAIYPIVLARFDDYWQIGFQVETLDNGLIAVFVPGSPSPQSGEVYYMTSDRVAPCHSSLAATLKCLRRIGVGSRELLHDISAATISAK